MTMTEAGMEFTRIAYFDNRGLYFETWYPTKHLAFLSGRATYWRVSLEELWVKITAKEQPHADNDGKHYACAVCEKAFAQFEDPLHLAENGMTGTGERRVVHAACWK